MSLQEVMSMTQAHEVGQLGSAAVLDRNDVIALQPVADTAARNGTDTVPTAQCRVEVRWDPAAQVAHGGDVFASLDNDLGERVAEQVFHG
jgi:hypothetical protein